MSKYKKEISFCQDDGLQTSLRETDFSKAQIKGPALPKSNQKEKSDLVNRHILSAKLACVRVKTFLLARTEGIDEGKKRKRFRDENPSKLSAYAKSEGSLAKSGSAKESQSVSRIH